MQKRDNWRPWFILITGLLVTIITTIIVVNTNEQKAKTEFEFQCNEIASKVDTRLRAHAQLLRSGAAFFASSDSVSREDWKNFIEQSKANLYLPGNQGTAFNLRITKDNLREHISKIRAEGFTDYKVWPEDEREIYTSIIFIEPFSGKNLSAFGFDTMTEPIRREAMERARDLGIAALSGKLFLVQETKEDVQPGNIMFVPVYQKGAAINTVEQRRVAIKGWVSSPYRMNDLISGIMTSWESDDNFKKYHLHIYDGQKRSPESLLFESHKVDEQKELENIRFSLEIPIDFNGHFWTLVFTQKKGNIFIDQIIYGSLLLGGLIISILLFLFTRSLIKAKYDAQEIAKTTELRESKDLLFTVLNALPIAVFCKDIKKDYQFFIWNAYAEDLIGLKAKDCIGKTDYDLFSKSDADLLREKDIEMIQSTGIVLTPEEVVNTTKGLTTLRTHKVVIRDENNKPSLLIGVTENITERKQIEAREYARTCILEHLVEGKPLSTILEFIVTYIEQEVPTSLCSILLLDNEGKHLLNGAAPSLPDFYNQAIDGLEIGDGVGSCGTAAYTKQRVIVEDILTHPYWEPYRGLTQKANLRSCWSEPIISSLGKVLGTFAIYHRETKSPDQNDFNHLKVAVNFANLAIEVKRTEDALKESEEIHKKLVEEIPDGVYKSTHEGKFLEINPAMVKMLGYNSKEELLAIDIKNDLYIEDSERDNFILNKLNQELGTFQVRKKDGSVIWVEDYGWYSFDKSGKITYHEGIMRDVTVRIQKDQELIITNKELERSEEKLKELNATKDRLFSIIGHDLRGPIGGFKQLIDFLISDDFDLNETETLSELMHSVQGTANTTYDLLENLLLWAKTQQNEITFAPVNCNLNEVTNKIIELLQEVSNQKKITIFNKIPKNQTVYADPNMLTTVIRNLISNAIKFTPNGKSIAVSINKDENHWVISVEDEGIGISTEDINNIFDANINFTTYGTNNEKGSGLGLMLCQEFVKKHDGKIWIESELGRGSDFKFSLPLNKS